MAQEAQNVVRVTKTGKIYLSRPMAERLPEFVEVEANVKGGRIYVRPPGNGPSGTKRVVPHNGHTGMLSVVSELKALGARFPKHATVVSHRWNKDSLSVDVRELIPAGE